ncbi:MAG: efflux RND transporter periplasmic adaptor subunit [Methylophilaceae bacterium]|nr:efflux RND transporter periplasmic adaptor subunit [Methylophilaceae bacterium]
MSNHQSSASTLPFTNNPKRTLVIVKRLGFILLLFFLLAGLWRLVINQSSAQDLKQRTEAGLQRSVIAVHSKQGESTHKLVLPASLRGNSETQLFSRSNGYLKAWYKTLGDHVKQGELLALIDVPELEHELTQARAARAQIKARLELASSTLQRWTQLKETDGAPLQEFDEKRSTVLQAQADMASAEANIKRLENLNNYRRIVAPFSGVITRRAVDIGSLITTGNQELFALTQIDPLRLTVWVPQIYANEVKIGQEVTVNLTESPEKAATAYIEHIAGALDPVNRTRQIEVKLPNPDGKLLPGSYVELSIKVEGKTSPLLVPANVLVINQEGARIVVVDNKNRVAFHPVKLGRDFGREVEIVEGIEPQDVLVASPSDLLVEGETVTVVVAKEKEKPESKPKDTIQKKVKNPEKTAEKHKGTSINSNLYLISKMPQLGCHSFERRNPVS